MGLESHVLQPKHVGSVGVWHASETSELGSGNRTAKIAVFIVLTGRRSMDAGRFLQGVMATLPHNAREATEHWNSCLSAPGGTRSFFGRYATAA